MKFKNDNRGVSEVIGAILMFGLLIALLAILQTQAIPAANEEVEFNHNQDVQGDIVKFQESTSRIASQGTSESTRIRMGTTYPSRMIFFNPPNPSGQLRTVGNQSASIQNVNATNPTVNRHFSGSLLSLETKRIEYRPNYYEYENAPATVLEYGAVYRDFGERITVDNPGQIISGNSISLTFFAGNISRSSGRSLSLEAQPTSAPARRVTIEAEDSNDNITIRLPSKLNATDWDQIIGAEENVKGIRNIGSSMVAVDLNSNKTYDLRMAKIGVGSGVSTPEASYIAPITNQQIQSKQANRLPIEIRDKYNNPVSGESVNISISSGQFQNGKTTIETTTTEDGQPAAQYFAGEEGVVTIEASFEQKPWQTSIDPENNKEDIRMEVAFNPALDSKKPTINNSDVSLQPYTVCGGSGTGVNLIDCTLNPVSTELYQIRAEYTISDEGGSSLDYMKIRVFEGDTLLTESTQSLSGNKAEGRYLSPLFPQDEGEPDSVEIIVYDNAGLSNSTNASVSA